MNGALRNGAMYVMKNLGFLFNNIISPGILGAIVALIMFGILPKTMLLFSDGYNLEFALNQALHKTMHPLEASFNGNFKLMAFQFPIIGFVIMALLYNLYRDKELS